MRRWSVVSTASTGRPPACPRPRPESASTWLPASPCRRQPAGSRARRPWPHGPVAGGGTSYAIVLDGSRRDLHQLRGDLGVGRAGAVRRAPLGDRAGAAGRLLGVAAAAAVEDQPVRQHRPVLLREELADDVL